MLSTIPDMSAEQNKADDKENKLKKQTSNIWETGSVVGKTCR